MNVLDQQHGDNWALYQGDSMEAIAGIPDASVHLSIFSPPFSNLYSYSPSERDCGNTADDSEFFTQFDYLLPELLRITLPGRLCAVHCKNLPKYKSSYGVSGIRDFRGEVIRHMELAGWVYHSEVVIWTDPVFEMQRTKAQRLLNKQKNKDASFSGQGMPEYLCLFRRWPRTTEEEALIAPVTHNDEELPLEMWQRYASPVWFDVNRMRVLNVEQARESQDEKHLAPLQLDVIERAIHLWSNPGDVIFSPFAGIGSEGVGALRLGRRFAGIELKRSYYEAACKYLRDAERQASAATLWDGLDTELGA